MTYFEAKDLEAKMSDDKNLIVKVVRILPENIDPPIKGDNGWDVEFEVID